MFKFFKIYISVIFKSFEVNTQNDTFYTFHAQSMSNPNLYNNRIKMQTLTKRWTGKFQDFLHLLILGLVEDSHVL